MKLRIHIYTPFATANPLFSFDTSDKSTHDIVRDTERWGDNSTCRYLHARGCTCLLMNGRSSVAATVRHCIPRYSSRLKFVERKDFTLPLPIDGHTFLGRSEKLSDLVFLVAGGRTARESRHSRNFRKIGSSESKVSLVNSMRLR